MVTRSLSVSVLVALGCACSSNDPAPDVPDASAQDVREDAAPAVPADVAEDTAADTSEDAPVDADEDVAPDAAPDAALDVADASDDVEEWTGTGCASYGSALRVGELPASIVEVSGIVRSRVHDGVFWVHGDSGQPAEVYAISSDGTLLATARLVDADGAPIAMIDWEDIAAGPCETTGETECIYVADVGDNAAARDSVSMFRFEDPGTLEDTDVEVTQLRMTYEIGPADVEAVFVDDAAGVVLLTKGPGDTRLLQAEWSDEPVVAADRGSIGEHADRLSRALLTGADYSPSLARVLVRDYAGVTDCAVNPDDPGDLTAWDCRFGPAGREVQGEAIAWAEDGAYVHLNEDAGATLFRVDCETAP